MNQTTLEAQIADAEEQLRIAMLESDVNALDELLDSQLMFTNHLGQLLGKKDDLAAHESGRLKVNQLRTSEQHLRVNGGVAVVSVRMQVSGTYAGNQADGDSRFTRVWAVSSDSAWRVVAAHSTVVA